MFSAKVLIFMVPLVLPIGQAPVQATQDLYVTAATQGGELSAVPTIESSTFSHIPQSDEPF